MDPALPKQPSSKLPRRPNLSMSTFNQVDPFCEDVGRQPLITSHPQPEFHVVPCSSCMFLYVSVFSCHLLSPVATCSIHCSTRLDVYRNMASGAPSNAHGSGDGPHGSQHLDSQRDGSESKFSSDEPFSSQFHPCSNYVPIMFQFHGFPHHTEGC